MQAQTASGHFPLIKYGLSYLSEALLKWSILEM
jgi:hypothetical protein